MHQIVFLDRDSLIANIRQPAFAHRWCDYPATSPDEVVERLRGATIAITNKVPLRADAIAQLPDLKMIAVAATGTDNVDLAACRERGIVVANIRNYSLVSVPEHCFALILAVRRNLRAYVADVEASFFSTSFTLPEERNHPLTTIASICALSSCCAFASPSHGLVDFTAPAVRAASSSPLSWGQKWIVA